MAATMLLLLTLSVTLAVSLYHTETTPQAQDNNIVHSFIVLNGNKYNRPLSTVKVNKGETIWVLILLVSGDVELNPGPRQCSIYPCGYCQIPVTWSTEGVCCDDCSIWHHRSCLELCAGEYSLLHRSHVQWLCCKCNSINVDSFTFNSFETDSNYYQPLADITLESVKSVFSPLKTSSPHLNRTSRRSTCSAKNNTRLSSSSTVPRKQNLRILNINCPHKRSEFTAALDYLKPDIVCGT
jgi:hypothetical protein